MTSPPLNKYPSDVHPHSINDQSHSKKTQPKKPIYLKTAEVSAHERLYAAWGAMMLETGFCEIEKHEHMMPGLRSIFSRRKLTENDVKILLVIAKKTH